MKKRLLSALLALVMVLALLPVSVFADPSPINADEKKDDPAVTVEEEKDGESEEDEETEPEDVPPAGGKAPVFKAPAARSGGDPAPGSAQIGMTAKYIDHNAEEKYNAKGDLVTSTAITDAPGYYVVDTTTTKGQTAYYKISSGVVVGGHYYTDVPKDNPTSVIVVGNPSITIDAGTSTSLTVDLYGSGATVTVNGSNLQTLNVTDSYYGKEFRPAAAGSRNAVTLSGMGTWGTQKSFTLNLTNVTVSSEISISGGYTHTVKLDNADATGGITLNGIANDKNGKAQNCAQTVNVNAENANYYRSSSVGSISVSGNSSKVTLVDVTAGDPTVSMTGTNTGLTVGGKSAIGGVTISDNDTAATGVYSSITVNSGVVGDLTDNGTKATGAVNITVNGGEMGDVDLTTRATTSPKPTIKVNSATIGDVTIDNGTLTVSGANADVGDVTLTGTAGFTLTGSNHTVGLVTAGANNKLSIPADSTNSLKTKSGTASSLAAYTGRGILGGTWDYPVPAAALSTSLVYELNVGGTSYTYYNADQLNEALIKQYDNAGSNGEGNGSLLCAVGKSVEAATDGSYYKVRFMNGKTLWGTMQVTGEMQIKLPTMINTVSVTKWADKNRSWNAGAMYPTPKLADVPADPAYENKQVWELNASGGITSGDITKITDVSVKGSWDSEEMGDVKATLNGTTITLSGAVPVNAGECNMTLYLTTDAVEQKRSTADDGTVTAEKEDVPVTLPVGVTYFPATKTLIFSNVANDKLTHGATLQFNENTNGVLRLSNGTKYTLNGSGLKERSAKITVLSSAKGDTDSFGHQFIEVSVNVSTLKTQADRQAVIDLLNGSAAKFDWSGSPAIREAVNAALATITDQQVDSWIATAQRTAWTKVNTGTYDTNKGLDTGYDKAVLVPYLQVNVTAWNPNGTLTANLVPSWRVEIQQTAATGNPRYDQVFRDPKNPNSLPDSVYIAKAGSALSLGSNVSEITDKSFDELNKGVEVKFAGASSQLFDAISPNIYMHQDATYAYKLDATGSGKGYLIRHGGGSSLGTVTINTTEPLITLYSKPDESTGTRTVVAYYNTLQAAANDALDQQHINVDQSYKGSMNISITGYARKFTIQANGNNVLLANASGGLVDLTNTGSLYTVQLNRDNTTVAADATTATIAVNSVANGSAVVSATTAKSGTTITVTCTPAAGYSTRSVTVSAHMTKTNTNSAVTATKVSDNVYSFKVPQGADTITVTPNFVLGTTPAAIPFTDVATNHWAYNSVKYVYDNGLMNGVNTAGTQFGGTQTLNRAMVVTILYRAAGSPYVGTSSSFSDVANNTWYSQAVAWANQNHIVEGYTNGTFQPTWNITRQELATILYRYNTTYKGRATTGSTTLANFPDQGNVSDWATAGMQWAVGNGIVNGITNGYSTTLSPSGSATRYEAATMLMRYGQGMGL